MDRDQVVLSQFASRARGAQVHRERMSGPVMAVPAIAVPVHPVGPSTVVTHDQGFTDGVDTHLAWATVGTSKRPSQANRIYARRTAQSVMRQ